MEVADCSIITIRLNNKTIPLVFLTIIPQNKIHHNKTIIKAEDYSIITPQTTIKTRPQTMETLRFLITIKIMEINKTTNKTTNKLTNKITQ